MNYKHIAKLLNTIFLIAQILIILLFAFRRQYTSVIQSTFIFIASILFIHFEDKKNLQLENSVRIMVILTIILHNFFGEYLNLYNSPVIFDKPLHFFGTFAFSLFIYSILTKIIDTKNIPKLFIFIFIISLGISLGTCFEIAEFLSDSVLKTNCQKGLIDTDLDLVFDILGAILAGTLNYKK